MTETFFISVLTCLLSVSGFTAEKNIPNPEPSGPKLVMTQLGKVIVDEPFTAASWQKN